MHDSTRCPDDVKHSLTLYHKNRLPTGGFLRAVLENNLFDAIGRADANSFKHLGDIVNYVYWELPSGCWGNKAKVDAWLNGWKEEE